MKKIQPSNGAFYILAFAATIIAVLSLNVVQAKQPRRTFSSPQKLIEYLNSYASNLPQAQEDKALLELIALQTSAQKSFEKRIFSPNTNRMINQLSVQNLSNPSSIKNESIRKLARSILDNGFQFSTSEGMNYIEIDYPRILKQYGRYASPQVFGYLEIMVRETAGHFAEDAALRISLDELSDRLVFIEKFAAGNKSFARIADVQDLYRKYCYAYLLGLNNTPAFDYQSFKLNASFLRLYQSVPTKYPGTVLAAKTAEYLKILQTSHFKRSKAVLVFASKASSSSYNSSGLSPK